MDPSLLKPDLRLLRSATLAWRTLVETWLVPIQIQRQRTLRMTLIMQVPPGPYLAKITDSIRLTEIYRVYKDEQQAFTAASIYTTNNTFVDLSTTVAGMNTITVPVPSRLYTAYKSDPRPLEGRRVAVKDLFDMAGLRTGGGSRAYFNTYPPRDVTAVAVQRLIDQVSDKFHCR